jgi:biopolymer transport protein ExbB/TolQ
MEREDLAIVVMWLVFILVCLGLIVGLLFAWPAYNRYQKVLNARNEIQVNEMKIGQTKQLVEVEKQKAEIKVTEAQGIAKSQDIINETLTDRYLQHEAIQAQERMAGSPNHTQIYIPVGTNGIPLVKTLNPSE